MTRERWGALATVVAAAALVAAACGVPSEDSVRAVDPADVPYGLADTTTTTRPLPTTTALVPAETTTATTTNDEVLTVYFVLGRRVRPVERVLRPPVGPDDALDELQRGPLEEDRPVGLRSAILPEMLRGVTVAGGIATVDLAPSILGLTTTEQVLTFAQIVATLSEQRGVGPVAFTIEGEAVEPYRGDGTLDPDTVSRDDYRNLLPFDPDEPPTSAVSTTAPTTTSPVTTEPATAAPPAP